MTGRTWERVWTVKVKGKLADINRVKRYLQDVLDNNTGHDEGMLEKSSIR